MRVEMVGRAVDDRAEGFDLRPPFGADFVGIQRGKVLRLRGESAEFSCFVYQRGNAFGREAGMSGGENEMYAQPEARGFFKRVLEGACRVWKIHHRGRGSHDAERVRLSDAARNAGRESVIIGVDDESVGHRSTGFGHLVKTARTFSIQPLGACQSVGENLRR